MIQTKDSLNVTRDIEGLINRERGGGEREKVGERESPREREGGRQGDREREKGKEIWKSERTLYIFSRTT